MSYTELLTQEKTKLFTKERRENNTTKNGK
jgi:hypothetical protein